MNTEVWLPLLTLGLGWAGSLATEGLRDRRLADRETRAREAESTTKQAERRDDFQRETLLGLQEAIVALGQATASIHREDRRRHREEGVPWSQLEAGEKATQSWWDASFAVGKLKVRVLDHDLRGLMNRFHDASTVVLLAGSEAEASVASEGMTQTGADAQQRLGELLRALY